MDILYEKLKQIKQRPQMYIKRKSLSYLKAYIDGYITRQLEIDNNYRSSFDDFGKFLENYYKTNISRSWDEIINFYNESEEEAFEKFYELLDKFLLEYKKQKVVYPLGTTVEKQVYRTIKVRHYTDHGNPKRCSNPHDHEVIWYPDNTFAYTAPINYYNDIPEL